MFHGVGEDEAEGQYNKTCIPFTVPNTTKMKSKYFFSPEVEDMYIYVQTKTSRCCVIAGYTALDKNAIIL